MNTKLLYLLIIIFIAIPKVFAEDPYKGMTSEDFKNHPDFIYIPPSDKIRHYVRAGEPIQLKDGRIVFRTDRTKDGVYELWMLDPNNPEKMSKLTKYNETHDNVDVINPIQLQDGRIVYSTDRTINGAWELWMFNPNDPERKTRLTKYNETHGDVDANYHIQLQDGRIIYRTDRSKNGLLELWMLDPNNPENKTRLTKYNETHDIVEAINPIQLQDGRIVYSTDRTINDVWELWMFNPNDPARKTRLTKYNETHGNVDAYNRIQLQDGRIIYRTDRSKNNEYELWTLDPNNPEKKTRLAKFYETNHIAKFYDLIQLQDGRIVFTTDKTKDTRFELWILDPNNPEKMSKLTKYNETHDDVDVINLIQLQDGRILYQTDRSKNGVLELWYFELDTGASYPLTSYCGGLIIKKSHATTSLKDISNVLPSSKSDFFLTLYDIKKKLSLPQSWKPARNNGSLFNLHRETLQICGFLTEHPSFPYVTCSLEKAQETISKIQQISNYMAIYITADIMIDFTTSKVAREKISPRIKQKIDFLKDKYFSSSLDDIVTTPTQIKIVVAAIDSLLKRGHFPNIKKGAAIKLRLAMELALNPSEIDYAALSEDLETYQDLFERLTLNPETKAHGMVIQTFLNNWSQ